jgi:hypothetical protein
VATDGCRRNTIMAVRVHVLRTCDRCGRPIETGGAVPIQQLKEGDTIPTFKRSVLRVTREEPSMDGGEPTVKVLGAFVDICDPCTSVVERALDTLLKRPNDEDEAATSGDPASEPKRKRAGRPPKSVAPDMPGPNGAVPLAVSVPVAPPVHVAVADGPSGGTTTSAPSATGAVEPASEVALTGAGEMVDEPF